MNINDNVTFIYIYMFSQKIYLLCIQHRLITQKRHPRTINFLKLILHYNGIGQRETAMNLAATDLMKVSIRASKPRKFARNFVLLVLNVHVKWTLSSPTLPPTRERNCLFDIDVYQRIENVARNGRYISRV